MRRTRCLLATLVASLFATSSALGDEPTVAETNVPVLVAASGTPRADAPLAWRWRRFQWWEYPITAASLGVAVYLRFVAKPPSADWRGGILVDEWVQDHTAIRNIPLRTAALTVTDVFFYGSMAYRLVDSAILPALIWRSPGVALQMSLIDLESFGFVAITLWGGQAIFGRERAFASRCGDPAFAASETGCSPNSTEHNRSFYAGHPAVVFAAAGLTCTHHRHLPLYGGGAGDDAACGAMIAAAAVTGVGRVVTEEHHASDVVIGFASGFVGGWILPELLHYYGTAKPRLADDAAPAAPAPAVRASLVPELGPRDVGLGLRGVF